MPMISTGRSPEPNPAYQQGLDSYFSPLEALSCRFLSLGKPHLWISRRRRATIAAVLQLDSV